MKYIVIFVFSVFISSVSQTILKSSANEQHVNTIKDYLNWKVIISYGLFFLSTLITTFAYRYVPLSLGTVLESIGYVFVTFLGVIFLKEKVGKRKLTGIVIILIGIWIFNQ